MKGKTALSSIDVYFLIRELKDKLLGARIQKIYQLEKEAHLELFLPGKGTFVLVLGDGKLFLTQHKFAYPEKATDFSMTLRKRLSGKLIKELRQHDFDRIVILETDDFRMIAELLPKGNIVLVDSEDNILAVLEKRYWSARRLKIKARYAFPPAKPNIFEKKARDMPPLLAAERKKLVGWLAEFFGGIYAEEICARAKIDKNKSCSKLEEDEILRVKKAANSLLEEAVVPVHILENEKHVDVTPISLQIYRNKEKKLFTTFNEAVETYFIARLLEEEKEERAREEAERRAELARIKKEQESAVKAMYKAKDEFAIKGRVIYENYVFLHDLLEKAKENLEEVYEVPGAKEKVKEIDKKEKSVTVELAPAMPGLPEGAAKPLLVKIFAGLSLWQNAARYFEKSKKLKEKVKGAEIALVKTRVAEEKVKKARKEKAPKVRIKEKVAKLWHEKFRWFRSSEGFLVVSGKDAVSNEALVKKHVLPEDIVLHADITGSPFTIIKTEGKVPGDATIKEAAQFTVAWSRAWRAGVGLADAYWIKPEQVSQKAPSGEFLPKGAFMIYGKKNVLKIELKLAIGIKEKEILAGPVTSVAALTPKFVTIAPGTTKAADLAKKIKARLFELGTKEQQEWLRKISLSEIQQFIPFGQGELSK